MHVLAPFHKANVLICRSETVDQRSGCEIQKERQEIRGSMLQKQGSELEERRVSVAAGGTIPGMIEIVHS